MAGPLWAQLRLPPGLEQTLPLNKTASFGGDALRVVDCPDEKDLPFGTCGNNLFGGFVLYASNYEGSVRIRFSPPVDNVSHFQVFFGVLKGDVSKLTAPRLFGEFPITGYRVSDVPGEASEGDLNLLTGKVTNLRVAAAGTHSGIQAVARANPNLVIPVFRWPGEYGDAWAEFEQRSDGLLDFTMRASTFLPLGGYIGGDPVRYPVLPCLTPTACASVPARGSSFHPHVYLSTKEPEGKPCAPNCPDIPFNTVREYTLFAHSSSFGDDFVLDIPELGGPAPGRSHLLGRLLIQFGAPTSMGLVPFVMGAMLPKGLLAEPPESPLSFPGVAPGFTSFDEFLRFPLQTYAIREVAMADDPFDFAAGAIDLRTGHVIGNFLYRTFFAQNLLFAILDVNQGRLEPASFRLRGPALFEKGVNGQTVFRFQGEAVLPFAGFHFPTPELKPEQSYLAGPSAELHLFVRLQATDSTARPSTDSTAKPNVVKAGGQDNVMSSIGDRFSYFYSIPCAGASGLPSFEYTNHALGATFRLRRLASATCSNSRTSTVPLGDFDTITFSGFGSWSKDSDLHLATVQISTSPVVPYVGIQIDGGFLSNVNTKPAEKPVP